MKEVGICSDEELLHMLKDNYGSNGDSPCILGQLDGNCFREFIDKAYPTTEELNAL